MPTMQTKSYSENRRTTEPGAWTNLLAMLWAVAILGLFFTLGAMAFLELTKPNLDRVNMEAGK